MFHFLTFPDTFHSWIFSPDYSRFFIPCFPEHFSFPYFSGYFSLIFPDVFPWFFRIFLKFDFFGYRSFPGFSDVFIPHKPRNFLISFRFNTPWSKLGGNFDNTAGELWKAVFKMLPTLVFFPPPPLAPTSAPSSVFSFFYSWPPALGLESDLKLRY